ncbi:CBS domain-containing protein [Aurantimonas aggregata]|uniref:CBS domain-containing protein n=1 Tax=Aurantimonas aggregata TaxID=2047720 RepID=A0A6L9MHD5_9HYPH|nr:CBS domain-containing protein [Aurantimonas aggregata]NDV86972.1 CBS domain-containing protein [Aurantimonas aggregata]
MKIRDRPEFRDKPKPLSFGPDVLVIDAAMQMAKRNIGSVMVIDANQKLLGVVTERDILNRLVARERDPTTTRLDEIMTAGVRVAKADDDLIEWMRIMSNERFRRLNAP